MTLKKATPLLLGIALAQVSIAVIDGRDGKLFSRNENHVGSLVQDMYFDHTVKDNQGDGQAPGTNSNTRPSFDPSDKPFDQFVDGKSSGEQPCFVKPDMEAPVKRFNEWIGGKRKRMFPFLGNILPVGEVPVSHVGEPLSSGMNKRFNEFIGGKRSSSSSLILSNNAYYDDISEGRRYLELLKAKSPNNWSPVGLFTTDNSLFQQERPAKNEKRLSEFIGGKKRGIDSLTDPGASRTFVEYVGAKKRRDHRNSQKRFNEFVGGRKRYQPIETHKNLNEFHTTTRLNEPHGGDKRGDFLENQKRFNEFIGGKKRSDSIYTQKRSNEFLGGRKRSELIDTNEHLNEVIGSVKPSVILHGFPKTSLENSFSHYDEREDFEDLLKHLQNGGIDVNKK